MKIASWVEEGLQVAKIVHWFISTLKCTVVFICLFFLLHWWRFLDVDSIQGYHTTKLVSHQEPFCFALYFCEYALIALRHNFRFTRSDNNNCHHDTEYKNNGAKAGESRNNAGLCPFCNEKDNQIKLD